MSLLTSLWVRLWARPQVLPNAANVRLATTDRELCFLLPTTALQDHEVLSQLLQRPEWQSVVNQRRIVLHEGGFISMQRWIGLTGSRLEYRIPQGLRALVDSQLESIQGNELNRDIDIVPISIFWGRSPNREATARQTLISSLWAESWSLTSGLHRVIATLINGRNLFVQFGDPLSLRNLIADETDAARAERRVARMCRMALYRQRTAMLGPEIASKRTIKSQVLRASAVRQAMHSEMRIKKLSRKQAIGSAQKSLNEIAADYSYVTVSILSHFFKKVWNRLYDGVEVQHLEHLQEVIDSHEVIYVPCHRSHLDYLLLSYVIYANGYVVPHIAAGVNLNLPIVGNLLRKGGAFFIRRSFAGNALYTAVFTRYLGLMMARGHALEYFIEGGRSRTGRLVTPKTGALTITVRSYLREPKRPVVFVPVYFGYERIAESASYLNELSGKPKQKETFIGLLKSLPALRQKFGKVHVNFGVPIHLDTLLDQYHPEWRNQAVEEKPAWLSPLVDDLAMNIMRRINEAAHVGPINLLALVLLSAPKRAMLESDLIQQLGLYNSLLQSLPYAPTLTFTELSAQEMVAYAERMQWIKRDKGELGDVISMSEENAIHITYFKNNVLHLITLPSAIACCFQNNRQLRTEDLQRLAWRIYPYLCDELFLRWDEQVVPEVVQKIIQGLADHRLLATKDEGATWCRPATDSAEAVQLSLLGQVSMQIIERYYLAVTLLLKAGSGRITQEELVRQCQKMVQQISVLYSLNAPEFFDQSLFKNFLDLLRYRSVLGVNAEGRLTFTDILVAVADDAEMVLHEQIRNSIFQVMHR
jgi:glycerol-3-phosphate O-acyltransferase